MYILAITVEIAAGADAEFGAMNKIKPTVNGKAATIYIPPTQTARFSMEYFFAKAVAWAVEQGITSGVGDNKFAPDDSCTRGQIMTFLYRAFAK